MTLGACQTITTIERSGQISEDIIEIEKNGSFIPLEKDTIKNKKAYEQIERIRNMSPLKEYVHIRTKNSFPSDAGIASSASGFSALTAALLLTFDLKGMFDDKKELSRQVRLCGSASAARSVYGGFVELIAGEDDKSSVCEQIADEHHWDLVDVIAVLSAEKKKTSTSSGHALADSSPYFETRIKEMQARIDITRKSIQEKNFSALGSLIEADTISMHAVMMTSVPPIYYWEPGTIAVMKSVMNWRTEALESYFSIDAGANVHVICEKKNAAEVKKRLQDISFVQSTIYNEPCAGTHEISGHLF